VKHTAITLSQEVKKLHRRRALLDVLLVVILPLLLGFVLVGLLTQGGY